MTHATHHDAGYSLVELVVVLLLLGMIALACESGLHFGAQVWTRSGDRIQSGSQLVTAQTVLHALLSHSLPRLKGDYVTLEGEPTVVRFDLAPPQAFQSFGTAHAVLRVVHSGAFDSLTLEMQSIAEPSIKKYTVLVDHIAGLRFSYLDASDKSFTWLSYWRDRRRLPDAVRITASNPTHWPTMIMRLGIAQSSSCSIDPVLMTCRKN